MATKLKSTSVESIPPVPDFTVPKGPAKYRIRREDGEDARFVLEKFTSLRTFFGGTKLGWINMKTSKYPSTCHEMMLWDVDTYKQINEEIVKFTGEFNLLGQKV